MGCWIRLLLLLSFLLFFWYCWKFIWCFGGCVIGSCFCFSSAARQYIQMAQNEIYLFFFISIYHKRFLLCLAFARQSPTDLFHFVSFFICHKTNAEYIRTLREKVVANKSANKQTDREQNENVSTRIE